MHPPVVPLGSNSWAPHSPKGVQRYKSEPSFVLGGPNVVGGVRGGGIKAASQALNTPNPGQNASGNGSERGRSDEVPRKIPNNRCVVESLVNQTMIYYKEMRGFREVEEMNKIIESTTPSLYPTKPVPTSHVPRLQEFAPPRQEVQHTYRQRNSRSVDSSPYITRWVFAPSP